MLLFYSGLIIIVIIGAVELNPKRFKGTSSHKDSDKFSGPFLTVSSVLVGIVSVLDRVTEFTIFTPQQTILGIVLVIIGFVVRTTAIRTLGKNFNYAVAPVKNLSEEGIYSKIRHPAYLGTVLYAVGTALFFSSLLGLVAALIVIFSVLYRIRVEENFLEETLGEQYKNYEKKTWRMIPYIY